MEAREPTQEGKSLGLFCLHARCLRPLFSLSCDLFSGVRDQRARLPRSLSQTKAEPLRKVQETLLLLAAAAAPPQQSTLARTAT